MNVWLLTVGEPLPLGPTRPRLLRAGLLAEALTRAGHAVHWWAGTFDHMKKAHHATATTTQAVDVPPGGRYTLTMLHGRAYHKNVSLARIGNHRDVAQAFARLAPAEARPDVILASMPTIELAAAGADYGRRHGVPVVIDVRDLWPDLIAESVPGWGRPLVAPVVAWMDGSLVKALGQAASVCGVTDEFVAWATDKLGRKPTALDRAFPLPTHSRVPGAAEQAEAVAWWTSQGVDLSDPRPLAVLVGSLVPRIELGPVVEAARRLPTWRFVLAGAGSSLEGLRRQTADLPNVVLPGFIDQPKIHALLHAATVGLLPYPTDLNLGRNLPNKVAEYAAAGLPLVTSLGGPAERLATTEGIGRRYPNGDAAALVAILTDLAGDPEACRAMGEAARRVARERFDTGAILAGMIDHLRVVAEAGRPGRVDLAGRVPGTESGGPRALPHAA